jgi:DNA modification methylase
MTERPSAGARTRSPRTRSSFRNRIIELRWVRAGDLAANPKNWRRHPERQRRALRALLGEIGYADALIAREEHGSLQLLDGHLRRELDPEQQVPVLVTDLTVEEGDKLLLTLDPIAGLAVADPGPLADLLASVTSQSAAVQELLASVAASAKLAFVRGLTDPDEVPPLPAKPRTKRGDVWRLGAHRIVCGDATDGEDFERLMAGARAEVMWTDPPYGVDYVGKTPQAMRIAGDAGAGLADLLRSSFAAIDEVLAPGAALYVAHPAGPQSVVFANAFLAQGWQLRQILVWVKDVLVLGHSDYHFRHEPLLYGCKRGAGRWGRGHNGWHGGNAETSVFEIARPRASREHPVTKPCELVRRCLMNSSPAGAAVLDPFLGSGTTLLACEGIGRRCFGLELDPRYADVAITRWERFTGRTAERE